MRYVELVPGMRSSALGFGCGPAMGSVGKERSTRAIAIALSEGINHFDVAPSYGYGEAEALLGDCVQGRRDEVVICTKFGIEATLLARFARPVKSLARRILRPQGKPQTAVAASAYQRLLRHVAIEPAAMVRSVERSLVRLQTDRLDILLLHEPINQLADPDRVFEAATQLKASGKIRAFGIAYGTGGATTHGPYLDRFDVLQFATPPPASTVPSSTQSGPCILFSPFADRSEGKTEALHRVQSEFPGAVILCSMFTEEHIRQNAAAFSEVAP